MKFLIMICLSALSISLNGYDVIVRTPEGQFETVSVADNQSIADFMDSLRMLFGIEYECVIDASDANFEDFQRRAESKRNYLKPPTTANKNDIAFIVNTLGMASLPKIAKERSALKRAGDRLENIHPFHFIGIIFADDEMKTSVHAMKNRGWVWGGFFDGINSSLTEEQKNNNLYPFVDDFAARLGISPQLILPSIDRGNWKELVNILIDNIPRNKNSDRYKM